MRTVRLALLACQRPTEGPWLRAQGNESDIKISGLGQGEHIELMIVIGELQDSAWFFDNGIHPIPFKRMERFRVVKHAKQGAAFSATSVEVVLNGTA